MSTMKWAWRRVRAGAAAGLLAGALGGLVGGAAVACWAGAAAGQNLDPSLDRLLKGSKLGTTKVGVMVLDVQSGRVLASHNADEPMIPASNQKVLSSAAALDVLGPDYEFRTELVWQPGEGPGRAGRIVVRGSGDPAFGDSELLKEMGLGIEQLLSAWTEAMTKAGVPRGVEVVVDDRVFDREWVHPTWPADQLNRWFCAQVSGLTFHTNTLSIFATPAGEGQAPTIKIEPRAPGIEVRNRAKSVKRGQETLWASRDPGNNEITLFGDSRFGETPVRVTVHEPPAVFGRILAERMSGAGIAPSGSRLVQPDENLEGGRVLHVVRTPIGTAARVCNVESQNLYAECFLKKIGHKVTGQPGSWRNGSAVIRQELVDRVGAEAGKTTVIADGSGMSRENRIEPRIMARWLRSVGGDDRIGQAFIESLPKAGRDGTLAKRFDGKRLSSEVRAKSGFLNRVSCLSGYVIGPDGRKVVFVVMTNDIAGNVGLRSVFDFQEAVVEMIDDALKPAARNGNRLGG
ncbi:MAG: D-alanyl-D-alanine carboxypeptidase/D-alanyl-D-alanine-endopeptidase [Phycisphaerales bacterium]|nr:D-alanyl-D-alanine carboxypeptidase/D-alanyl-D-alanine-endopeptidase [Phycisphaerales bacterium]